ncbi:hypothetical protein ABZ990_20975 [Streptomyces sp. NPDC046203]|uniref:hypothetical protein n=1 Tax=Streptomyces sp. NPDC046203 TaxID=3154602 RepID=UPI0033F37BC0
MMVTEFHQVIVLSADKSQQEVWDLQAGEECRLDLVSPHGARWSAMGGDLFEALENVRLQIEPLGYLLLCNGARVDAHPSGMSRDMSGGRTLYLLEKKGVARKHVFIFDHADPTVVGTVAEQREFYEAWLRIPRRYRLTDRARAAALELWSRWRDR